MSALTFVSLVLGTFVSEDLACITAGLLIQRGEIGAASGVLACAVGIFAGDVGIWGAGRLFGRAALGWPWLAGRVDAERAAALRAWLERHAAGAIVGSRFLPGTRLPMHLIAGFLELPARVYVTWTLVATAIWTPIVVLLTASVGEALMRRLLVDAAPAWLGPLVTAALVVSLLHLVRAVALRRGAASA